MGSQSEIAEISVNSVINPTSTVIGSARIEHSNVCDLALIESKCRLHDSTVGRLSVVRSESIISASELMERVLVMEGANVVNSTIGPGSLIGQKSRVFESHINKSVTVLGSTIIEECEIDDNVKIGSGCHLVGVSIASGVIIDDGTTVRRGTVIGRDSFIGRRCLIGVDVKIGESTAILNYVELSSLSKVGNESILCDNVVCAERVTIGDGRCVAPGLSFRDGDTLL